MNTIKSVIVDDYAIESMSESEVMLKCAEYLVSLGYDEISINMDGMHIKIMENDNQKKSYKQIGDIWQSENGAIKIETNQINKPDITAKGKNKPKLIVECKKGWFVDKKGNPEYSLFHTAIGQLLKYTYTYNEIPIVAMPVNDRLNNYIKEYLKKTIPKQIKLRALLFQKKRFEESREK